MKSVSIFGAGIAGLSCAHELIRLGYKVNVYEPLSCAGGLARSECLAAKIAGEVSWRGYGSFYHNCFKIMTEIPTSSTTSVYDKLSRPIDFLLTKKNSFLMDNLTFKDRMRIYFEVFKHISSCGERRSEYAKINASDYLKPLMSIDGHAQFTSMFGPWVGIDSQRASLHHVMSFIKRLVYSGDLEYTHIDSQGEWVSKGGSSWSVFTSPTSVAWFDPWVKYLELLGVVFHYKVGLESLSSDMRSKIITKSILTDGTSVHSDFYICAIGPFQMKNILSKSEPVEDFKKDIEQFTQLTSDGEHLQVSFRLGFRGVKTGWSGTRKAVIVSDSPFNITMYQQNDLWTTFDFPCQGKGVDVLWSGTACVSYINGIVYNKPVVHLTKEEFQVEIIAQLGADKGFQELVKDGSGVSFDELVNNHLVYFEVWNTFRFPENRSERLSNPTEPKFVDSFNTREHQPSIDTQWKNMFYTGGHVQNTVDLYSMEAAAETGRKAAGLVSNTEIGISQTEPDGTSFLRNTDSLLYKIGGPPISHVFIFLTTLAIFQIIIILVYKIVR